MKKLLAISILALAASAASAQAGPIQERMQLQRERIAQGCRSGELTWGEAHRLRREERRIAWERGAFLANDGRLGPWERAHLRRDLNRESRAIYRLKHNDRERG
jgi:hypothetical protein